MKFLENGSRPQPPTSHLEVTSKENDERKKAGENKQEEKDRRKKAQKKEFSFSQKKIRSTLQPIAFRMSFNLNLQISLVSFQRSVAKET